MPAEASFHLFEDMFQISILKKSAAYLVAFQLLSHPTSAFCDGHFYVIWRDIGLPDAVRLVSQYSGRTILLGQEVHGTINLASAAPLSPDEIFTLFQKSLRERGLALEHVDDNGYQVKTAEEAAKNMPPSVALPGKQEETPPPTAVAQNNGNTAESKSRFNDQPAMADSGTLQPPVARRRHIGAIFASEERARSVVARLHAAGAEAEVIAPGSPADKDFSIVLLYRDNAESYQAMVSAIQRAGLHSLISTPTLSVAAPAQKK